MLLSFLNAFAYSPQVPWLHATYAVLGAILFTLVGVKHPPCVISCGCFCGSLLIPSAVPGVRHSDVAREQALHHKPRGIHICHPQHLPGHRLPVQLPAADLGRRTRVTLPGRPVHHPVRPPGYLIPSTNTTALLIQVTWRFSHFGSCTSPSYSVFLMDLAGG